MDINFLAILGASLIPLAVGFIWYNNAVFGKAWMRESGVTQEQIDSGKMPLIFGLSLFFSLMLAFQMQFLVIHQAHIPYLLMNVADINEIGTASGDWMAYFNNSFGDFHRTFGHGVIHGVLSCIFLILPVLAINGLFERKSFKYIMLHFGYWTICFALMGGVICQWL